MQSNYTLLQHSQLTLKSMHAWLQATH